jgi:hypothetical protein
MCAVVAKGEGRGTPFAWAAWLEADSYLSAGGLARLNGSVFQERLCITTVMKSA